MLDKVTFWNNAYFVKRQVWSVNQNLALQECKGHKQKGGVRGRAAAKWHSPKLTSAPDTAAESNMHKVNSWEVAEWKHRDTEPSETFSKWQSRHIICEVQKMSRKGKKNRGSNPEVRMSEACACIWNISSARGCVPVPRGGCCGRAQCECTAHSASCTAWQNLPR